MFEAERTAVGLKLRTIGQHIQDAAPEVMGRWDPNEHQSVMGTLMEKTGVVVEFAGQKMLPSHDSANNNSESN